MEIVQIEQQTKEQTKKRDCETALFLFVATSCRMFSEFKRALDGQQWFARTSSSE